MCVSLSLCVCVSVFPCLQSRVHTRKTRLTVHPLPTFLHSMSVSLSSRGRVRRHRKTPCGPKDCGKESQTRCTKQQQARQPPLSHSFRHQDKYCYCGGPFSWDSSMLRCSQCLNLFHTGCVECLGDRAVCVGDWSYEFQCKDCSPSGQESYTQTNKRWQDCARIGLLGKIVQHTTSDQCVHFRISEICDFIDKNWNVICQGRKRTPTWHNTISASVTTRLEIFKPSAEDGLPQGKWTLRRFEDIFPSTAQLPKHIQALLSPHTRTSSMAVHSNGSSPSTGTSATGSPISCTTCASSISNGSLLPSCEDTDHKNSSSSSEELSTDSSPDLAPAPVISSHSPPPLQKFAPALQPFRRASLTSTPTLSPSWTLRKHAASRSPSLPVRTSRGRFIRRARDRSSPGIFIFPKNTDMKSDPVGYCFSDGTVLLPHDFFLVAASEMSGDCFVAQALSFFCSSDGRHAVHVRWFLRSFECGGLAEDHDHEVLMSPQETNLYLSSVLGLACVYRVANLAEAERKSTLWSLPYHYFCYRSVDPSSKSVSPLEEESAITSSEGWIIPSLVDPEEDLSKLTPYEDVEANNDPVLFPIRGGEELRLLVWQRYPVTGGCCPSCCARLQFRNFLKVHHGTKWEDPLSDLAELLEGADEKFHDQWWPLLRLSSRAEGVLRAGSDSLETPAFRPVTRLSTPAPCRSTSPAAGSPVPPSLVSPDGRSESPPRKRSHPGEEGRVDGLDSCPLSEEDQEIHNIVRVHEAHSRKERRQGMWALRRFIHRDANLHPQKVVPVPNFGAPNNLLTLAQPPSRPVAVPDTVPLISGDCVGESSSSCLKVQELRSAATDTPVATSPGGPQEEVCGRSVSPTAGHSDEELSMLEEYLADGISTPRQDQGHDAGEECCASGDQHRHGTPLQTTWDATEHPPQKQHSRHDSAPLSQEMDWALCAEGESGGSTMMEGAWNPHDRAHHSCHLGGGQYVVDQDGHWLGPLPDEFHLLNGGHHQHHTHSWARSFPSSYPQ